MKGEKPSLERPARGPREKPAPTPHTPHAPRPTPRRVAGRAEAGAAELPRETLPSVFKTRQQRELLRRTQKAGIINENNHRKLDFMKTQRVCRKDKMSRRRGMLSRRRPAQDRPRVPGDSDDSVAKDKPPDLKRDQTPNGHLTEDTEPADETARQHRHRGRSDPRRDERPPRAHGGAGTGKTDDTNAAGEVAEHQTRTGQSLRRPRGSSQNEPRALCADIHSNTGQPTLGAV